MKIDYCLLSESPNHLDTIVDWYFEEWAKGDGVEKPELKEKLTPFLGKSISTCAVCGIVNGKLISTVQLKIRENKSFPQFKHWIGGVYVEKQYRGNQAASDIVEYAISIARHHGIDKLYLQTEKEDGGLYRRLGFKPVCTAKHGRYDVTIYSLSV